MTKSYLKTKRRLRSKRRLIGATKPRLIVFRSNKHIYAQIFDAQKGKTIVGTSDLKDDTGTKVKIAEKVGEDIAKQAIKSGIKEVVFDRQGYKYHGRVKALAEKAREAGLKF